MCLHPFPKHKNQLSALKVVGKRDAESGRLRAIQNAARGKSKDYLFSLSNSGQTKYIQAIKEQPWQELQLEPIGLTFF